MPTNREPAEPSCPPLETQCDACQGTGTTLSHDWCPPRYQQCTTCDGHGHVPTEFGDAILGFVRQRLKFDVKAGLIR